MFNADQAASQLSENFKFGTDLQDQVMDGW